MKLWHDYALYLTYQNLFKQFSCQKISLDQNEFFREHRSHTAEFVDKHQLTQVNLNSHDLQSFSFGTRETHFSVVWGCTFPSIPPPSLPIKWAKD